MKRVTVLCFVFISGSIMMLGACTALKHKEVKSTTATVSKTEHKINKMPDKSKVWVFLLAGQSNMAGRGVVEPQDTITTSHVLTINKKNEIILAKNPLHFYSPEIDGTGCGLTFGKELIKHIPKNVYVLLLPTAVGGSSIKQWVNDSVFRKVKLLTNFKAKVDLGKKYGVVKGILWHQGESDANPEGILHRKEYMSRLFTEFRNAVGNNELPILMGELGSYSKDKDLWNQMNEQIRQYAASDKYSSVFSTADLVQKGDYLHFDSASQREMGKRFAEDFIKKFKNAAVAPTKHR
ncbi:sialate O-acetylesterase [Flavobacterium sp. WC2509]|uniref:sialate O-acetylesterase n=1 Tax=Flavobacterium sp. WC2509 TaxID=3461406 RepID=UPI0040446B7F